MIKDAIAWGIITLCISFGITNLVFSVWFASSFTEIMMTASCVRDGGTSIEIYREGGSMRSLNCITTISKINNTQ